MTKDTLEGLCLLVGKEALGLPHAELEKVSAASLLSLLPPRPTGDDG